jgi:hypothetical protein
MTLIPLASPLVSSTRPPINNLTVTNTPAINNAGLDRDSLTLISILLQLLTSQISQNNTPASPASPEASSTPANTNVPFSSADPYQYANFLGSWDDAATPVLSALVKNADQYSQLFHPAPTMGNTKPYAPDSSLYNSKDLVVLGRVLTGNSTDVIQAMQPSKVLQNGNALDVYYNYSAPAYSSPIYSMKIPLTLEIPKGNYSQVNIYENGNKVEQLNVSAGQWNNVGIQ